jgi:diadenosine tetraphosphatase ApaH/serine/threonine PP2A family protein phosphatase
MLARPESVEDFESRAPHLQPLWDAVREMAAATREALGPDRLAWLGDLPPSQAHGPLALVHASPESPWRAPGPEASDAELESVYRPLGRPIAVYGHIHRPYVHAIPGMIVANTGSVGLPYDGDHRAAYLLVDDSEPSIRRVVYEINRERELLSRCGLPHADWIAKMLLMGYFQMP